MQKEDDVYLKNVIELLLFRLIYLDLREKVAHHYHSRRSFLYTLASLISSSLFSSADIYESQTNRKLG